MVECGDCGGSGSVPAGGWEPPEAVDNGAVECLTCHGSGTTAEIPGVPAHPDRPFDGSHLSEQQVIALSDDQMNWAELTKEQVASWDTDKQKPPVQAPREAQPERIPAPEDLAQIKEIFAWVDAMSELVRGPTGMSWRQIQVMMVSAEGLAKWALSEPAVQYLYRYRIDAPLDPDNSEVPDHPPEDWTS